MKARQVEQINYDPLNSDQFLSHMWIFFKEKVILDCILDTPCIKIFHLYISFKFPRIEKKSFYFKYLNLNI